MLPCGIGGLLKASTPNSVLGGERMRVLRAIAVEIGVFIVVLILGNVAYRAAADLVPRAHLDRSPDAAQGAAVAVAVVVLLVRIVRHRVRRKKPA
jgi:hypothetical protein